MAKLQKFSVQTDLKQEFFNLDRYIQESIDTSGVDDGIALIYCPHTTAAITINENADPDVRKDLNEALNETFPNHSYFVHAEGNSDGHMKSSVIGASEMLIIDGGQVVLGTWQSVDRKSVV